MTRVAFPGALGAYSEEAARAASAGEVEVVPAPTNADVTRAVSEGTVTLGVLPIENTLAGSVYASYDALVAFPDVHAVGQVVLPIHHCVLGIAGATLAEVTTVESHPVALAQCTDFFADRPWIEARAVYDTAGAASDVARRGDPRCAALASRAAGERYGLQILAESVEDRVDNQTRFLVVARSPIPISDDVSARTLLVVTAHNVPGALMRLLAPLAERDLNLVKLESRPTGEPWMYRFLIEFEHVGRADVVRDALAVIRETARTCRVVGSYPAGFPVPDC
jgi:prephenate dehydratase